MYECKYVWILVCHTVVFKMTTFGTPTTHRYYVNCSLSFLCILGLVAVKENMENVCNDVCMRTREYV